MISAISNVYNIRSGRDIHHLTFLSELLCAMSKVQFSRKARLVLWLVMCSVATRLGSHAQFGHYEATFTNYIPVKLRSVLNLPMGTGCVLS